tara:strand:+ start:55 stop:606 length:552 start_codon:yes stop_codon:yes gene_type:complete
MKRLLAKFYFKLSGWKVVGGNEYPDKCVVICAPHTSNWDFFIGMCYGYIMDIKFKYLMKKELFLPLLGLLIKLNGGIPVSRQKSSNLVEYVSNIFNNYDQLYFVITPEGTRSWTEKWKTGFYYISLRAKVPILLLKMDYQLKEVGVICEFNPSGNFKTDMNYIQKKYKDVEGKIPSLYNQTIC